MVFICWELQNKLGMLLIKCCRSSSLSIFSLRFSGIIYLYGFGEATSIESHIASSVILVRDGAGGVEFKSIGSTSGGLVTLTFLELSFFFFFLYEVFEMHLNRNFVLGSILQDVGTYGK